MKWSLGALVAEVPPAVVTFTSTTPAEPAGEVQVIEVAVLEPQEVPALVPNCTPEAAVRLVPVIVTLVPPAVGPDTGETPVTVGAAT